MPVISEPVPAVVGTQTMGTLFFGKGFAARRKAATSSSQESSVAASLPASSAEPPPRQTTAPAPADFPSRRAASTCASFGSPAISA